MTWQTIRQGLISPRVPYDPEQERYCPGLEAELREVQQALVHNQMLFDLETDPDLVEQRIYERQALQCRYRYLLGQARALGLHACLAACG